MRKIVQLPSEVSERIAAGEVVERPASVVKELIENAVDAGATEIALSLRKGGKDLIRVQDNGHGIPAEELPLAVARYATSKIARVEDLWRVATLGFRGEALASIGQVAELTVTSAVEGGEGATITVKGGATGEIKPAACPRGTIIEVRNLFFTVPARRKFLKQDAAEFGRAAEWVTRVALSAPGTGFTLEHDGKVVWKILPDATLAERMGVFFGPDVAAKVLAVDSQGPIAVKGAVARPEIWRTDRKSVHFFVNGRHVRDPMLGQALEEAFRGYLIPGRFPVAVLGILVDPESIDVNVHPAKAEVRFSNGREVFQAVVRATRAALAGIGPRAIEPAAPPPDESAFFAMPPASAPRAQSSYRGGGGSGARAPERGAPAYDVPSLGFGPPAVSPRSPEPAAPPAAPRSLQIACAYLVRETSEGIEIIDQHALHEKILYHTICARLAEGALPAQELLFPAPVRLGPDDVAEVEARSEELAGCGLTVDVIGPDTVVIRSVPALGEADNPELVFREVLAGLAAGRDASRSARAARLACALAVKAGRKLGGDEAAALLRQADGVADLDTCPHGRPTRLLLSFGELEKHFDRK